MQEDIEYNREEVEHRARNAVSTLIKGISTAASIGATLRYFSPRFSPGQYFDMRSLLRWIGVRRGRSAFGTLALIGVGAVAGAGIAMFVSPRSGRDTRQTVARGFRSISRKGRELVETASSQLGIGEGGNGGHQRAGAMGEGQKSEGQKSEGQKSEGQKSEGQKNEATSRTGSMGMGSESRPRG